MGAYPRVSVEYRYLIRIQYGYVSVLEYQCFIGSNVRSPTLSISKCLMWYLSHNVLPLIGLVFWVGLKSYNGDFIESWTTVRATYRLD